VKKSDSPEGTKDTKGSETFDPNLRVLRGGN